jgi:hypothetical protein
MLSTVPEQQKCQFLEKQVLGHTGALAFRPCARNAYNVQPPQGAAYDIQRQQ